jgi:hypothetical protein
LLLVEHLRSNGDAELERVSSSPVLVRPAPVAAAAGLEAPTDAEAREIPERWIRHEDNVTPRPSVTAVRPTLRHVLLTPEGEASVTAPSGLHMDACSIVEHRV